jgi:hypothetical protein
LPFGGRRHPSNAFIAPSLELLWFGDKGFRGEVEASTLEHKSVISSVSIDLKSFDIKVDIFFTGEVIGVASAEE